MDGFLTDLRQAVRRFALAPAFTLIATLTLALGVGATTAIYSVLDAILLRPLPYAEPAALVRFWSVQRGGQSSYFGGEAMAEWRTRQDLFAAVEPFRTQSVALLGSGEPQFVLAAELGGGLMPTLGVPARIGRTIQLQDAEPGRDGVVVLSDALWRSRFAADREILGRTIRIDDRTREVIGVMPAWFRFPSDRSQLWVPLTLASTMRPANALARLLPGVTREHAQHRVDAIAASLDRDRPSRTGWQIALGPLQGQRVNPSERMALYVLFGAVSLVLLIACANLANLLLVQGAGREREIAVRAVVGASRTRLVQQLVTETFALALAGGAAGILVATWAIDLLAAHTPRDFTFLSTSEIALDGRVLVFAAAVTLLTAVLAGSLPALRASRTRLHASLKAGARSAAGSARQDRLRRAFVVVQLALTLMLLVGAGLLARTFLDLTRVNPGFDPRRLVTVDLSMPRWKYGTRDAQLRFFDQVVDRLRSLPGVSSVTVAGGKPPTGGGISFGLRFEIDGLGVILDDPLVLLPFAEVKADYFSVLGIPLVAGRTFSADDGSGSPAIVISRGMANRLWKGANPVGQRIRLGPDRPWLTVVGVVGDVYQLEYDSPRGLFAAYYPRNQSRGMPAQETLIVRTSEDPARIVPLIRRAIWSVDPDQPILNLATMDVLYREFLGVPRFQAMVMGAFALIGLAIACVGLYGVLSYAISQRTREFGIRMALGARRWDVLAMVLRQAAGLVALGLLLGTAGSLALTRTMSSLLVNIAPHDPITYALVIAGLAGIAFTACWIPARRATRVDPVVALRCE
jgi:putative ABC transport system permease protein